MKYLFFLLPLITCAQSRDMVEIYPGIQLRISNDRQFAHAIHEGQMIYYKSNEIRALIVINKIDRGSAEYKARIFETRTKHESRVTGNLEEVYEKIKLANGDIEVVDKGSNLTINLKHGVLKWSFGEKGKCYVYHNVDESKLFILDSDSFEVCVLEGQ